MFKNLLTTAVTTAVLAVTVTAGSAQADWRNDAMMAAGMATVAAGTASALANGGYGYHRSSYRPRPTYYRMRPTVDCCYERVQWRRAPVYAPY